ncbi:ORF-96 [Catopsilia pomona nucleopolyhedrovirus]|uniref:ORF-96 n=1 Tax=Catopsilia pomona nucleopolyhedrovirus TaxID=1850906 RepID=A0A172WZH4_9ABAC|nr:ORF-96 [Catopsilia pomona nucleopolyhedrovirus]ANF29744.1 ORF-96 [Catopsilia pomona nucleopolyhedrovirus]
MANDMAQRVRLTQITVNDCEQFDKRLDYVTPIATMMRRTVDAMQKLGHCNERDADSLCLSDDTAAWLCGHKNTCTFVSFRVHIDNFVHPNGALKHFKFEESLAQSQHVGQRYTYMNFALFKNIVAIKLIVYTRTHKSNMYADGLPYFVKIIFAKYNRRRVCVRMRTSPAQPPLDLPSLYEKYIEEIND